MKKCLMTMLIILQFSCGDGGSETTDTLVQEAQALASSVHVILDMRINNYSPAPLNDVVVDMPLAISLAGFQAVSTFGVDGASSEKFELRTHEGLPAIARIEVGKMGPREKISKTINLMFSYQEGAFPFASFQPLEDTSKTVDSEHDTTAANDIAIAEIAEVAEVAEVKGDAPLSAESEIIDLMDSLLSVEDHALLDQILKLQQSGQDVYVFSGVVCPKQETCQFTEKKVWIDYPGLKNSATSVDEVHFVFEAFKTEESLKNALVNKKRFVVSSAVVELR